MSNARSRKTLYIATIARPTRASPVVGHIVPSVVRGSVAGFAEDAGGIGLALAAVEGEVSLWRGGGGVGRKKREGKEDLEAKWKEPAN